MLQKNAKITPPPFLLNFLAMILSAVYRHFLNEGSKFHNRIAAKDSQDCDSIIPLHFCLLNQIVATASTLIMDNNLSKILNAFAQVASNFATEILSHGKEINFKVHSHSFLNMLKIMI